MFSRFGTGAAPVGRLGVGATGRFNTRWGGRDWYGRSWRNRFYGFNRFPGWGWNYGLGWGWGWGLGWGLGYFDPCWNNWLYGPGWAWDYPSCYGYSYYSPYINYYPEYDDSADSVDTSSYSAPADNTPVEDENAASPYNPAATEENADNTATGSANSAQPILIFLKNGAEFDVTSYWFEGGKLHYTLADGGEIAIGVDQVDLQRTVQQNARRGVQFKLEDSQGGSSPAPSTN
ncbi:MAG TPA: hypothetical protein VEH50_08515 [Methylomirabilota bacterium]|nr:hypothetical protein [Methylomirabilota bacterium]